MTIFNNRISTSMAGRYGMTALGATWFKRADLQALPKPAMSQFLRQIVHESCRSRLPVSHDAVVTLGQKLENKGSDGVVATLGGLEWHLRGEIVWVYAEAELTLPESEIDTGQVLYDRVWQIMSPLAGILRPLGSQGAAAFRKRYPEIFENLTIIECDGVNYRMPQRALWRLPTIYLTSKTHELSHMKDLITLEDGTIIPHVLTNEDFNADLPLPMTMCHNKDTTKGLMI
jgi:hypothetical protein